jgi:hypothetical protein
MLTREKIQNMPHDMLRGLFGGGMSYDPYQGKLSENVDQQRKFVEALNAQTPEAIAAQRQLLGQVQAQASGQGPSVAQEALSRGLGQSAAQIQSALAGQRGSAANVGLAARNIANVGAQQQQDLASQAAMLRAQETLAARQQLQGLTGQQLGQVQAGLSGQAQAATGLESIKQKAEADRAQRQGNILGQVLGAAGTVLNPLGTVIGGALGKATTGLFSGAQGPKGSNISDYTSLADGGMVSQPSGYFQHIKQGLQMAHGGKVPAMVSPGERYLPPSEVEKVAEGKKSAHKAGEKIQGKAKVSGDSLKNDTVSKTLTEGGIVIPRSVMQSKNPADSAQKFVSAVLAKQKMKRK